MVLLRCDADVVALAELAKDLALDRNARLIVARPCMRVLAPVMAGLRG
ncbi:MAG: hypothetical protein IPK26_17950, partial [Planctomycetes bacterium]|nr:hypothetical protein [Planctomycetota bacterium]